MSKKHSFRWFLAHALSPLLFNHNYDVNDFWWGNEDLLGSEVVRFRYIKLYIANFIAWILKFPFIILLGLICSLDNQNPIISFLYGFAIMLFIVLVAAFLFTLLNVHDYKTGTRWNR